jgi:hypothetical protein
VETAHALNGGALTNLYRNPANVDGTDYLLSRKTVLGVFPETEKDGFIRIEAYDPVGRAYRRNLYIKISTISYVTRIYGLLFCSRLPRERTLRRRLTAAKPCSPAHLS